MYSEVKSNHFVQATQQKLRRLNFPQDIDKPKKSVKATQKASQTMQGIKCNLFLGSKEEVLARGKAFSIGGKWKVNGSEHLIECHKILVLEVLNGKHCLVIPTKNIQCLDDAHGKYILWPKESTELLPSPEVSCSAICFLCSLNISLHESFSSSLYREENETNASVN